MRKKIEELRNREEGFTLVELLAVIVILGIIVAIAVPAIGGVIDDSRANAEQAEAELVIDAATLYFTATGNNEDGANVGVDTLLKEGYLETEPTYNDSTGTVTRTRDSNGGGYTYKYGDYTSGDINNE